MGKTLYRLTKKQKTKNRRVDTNYNIRRKNDGIIIDPTNIKCVLREYYKELYAHKCNSMDEIEIPLNMQTAKTH